MPDLLVDLFSDTATQPTQAMLQAMTQAPLGDEQRGTDPTVRRLERRAAEVLGTECAVLCPTATMANQIAIALHCGLGDEVLCHPTAHVVNHEGGGLAANSGVQCLTVPGERGIFTADALRTCLRKDDPHHPISRAVVVENTSNAGGGSIWPDAVFDGIVEVCREQGLALHVDGARLFNAAVAKGVSPAHWAARANSVQVCFSKGLGCPFGAVLGTASPFEGRVRRIKQRLGGALRQAGIVAAAMLHALEHHVERLSDDHARATRLARALGSLPGVQVDPVETNLVFFRRAGAPPGSWVEKLRARGVLVSPAPADRMRACLHLGISDADLDRAIQGFTEAFSDV